MRPKTKNPKTKHPHTVANPPPTTKTKILLLFLTLLPLPTLADYQEGLSAYQSGDYKTAMTEWQAVISKPPGSAQSTLYAESHYAIGMLYWKGQGVNTDYKAASIWLHKAAELGNRGAQSKLGFLYAEGITVHQNYFKAFQWFSKAAKQGDIDGLYNLGIFYLNGWGIEKDNIMAAQYLAAASAQGDQAAEKALQSLLNNMQKPQDQKPQDQISQVQKPQNQISQVQKPQNQKPQDQRTQDQRPQDQRPQDQIPPESIILPSEWILAQDPNHYTIQVIGLSTLAALEKLVQGHPDLSPIAAYSLKRNGKLLHLLVQGDYPDLKSAQTARDGFPEAVQKPKNVWIRQFGKIQEIIKAK